LTKTFAIWKTWKSHFPSLKHRKCLNLSALYVVLIRDERTVKFFSPSPVLIRQNWIRSSPDVQKFWKSWVWSSPDLPM